MFDFFKLAELWKEFTQMSKKWKGLIVALLVVMAALVGVIGLQGCQSPTASYVEANYQMAKLIVPDMQQYIENDEKLMDVSKKARLKAIEEYWKLCQKAYIDLFGAEPE